MRYVVLALLVACGGSVSSGDDGPGSGSGSGSNLGGNTFSAEKAFCVSETNRYRAMVSKPALTESAVLESYADVGAMVDFSSMPHDHFTMTNGGGIAMAENECPVQGNWMLGSGQTMMDLVGQCVAAFYAEGPGTDYNTHGHYINMMGPYTMLGCGIYQMGTGVTIVQDYGD